MTDIDLSQTKWVVFELSNTCPYASQHKECPLHLQVQNPVTLPSRIVLDVMSSLRDRDWGGTVEFHNYCEPTSDPRLFWLIGEAKQRGFGVRIWTNGWNMSQTLLDELVTCGVTEFRFSAYGDSEMTRLTALRSSVPLDVQQGFPLDGRLHLYEFPVNQLRVPCQAPLQEIVIRCTGRLGLCCLDWREDHDLGDLNVQSFDELLSSDQVWSLHERLSRGDRYLNLCSRCLQGR